MLDHSRDLAVRPRRQGSNGLAAGADGQPCHGHRCFDHRGESVRQDDSAEFRGEDLQPLSLGEFPRPERLIQFDEEPWGKVRGCGNGACATGFQRPGM